jgi:tetratricopeptide (TPR) repeat protein
MLILLLALLGGGNDEKKSVEAVCPVDGRRFTATEVTLTNHWGGRDADGCPHAFKTTPLEHLAWSCPGCGFTGRKSDYAAVLTEEEKAALKAELKPAAKDAPGWARFELMARTARVRKQLPQAEALAWMHAAWSARQGGATDFKDFEEWDQLKETYSLTQTPMQYGLAKNRTDLDLGAAVKVEKDLAAGRYEKGPNRVLARYLAAFLWRKHGELAEAEKALERLAALKGENSVVDDASGRMKESLPWERDSLGKAREAWRRAVEIPTLEKPQDRAQAAYLVGELSRRLGDRGEAESWYQKALEAADLPALKKLVSDQRLKLR